MTTQLLEVSHPMQLCIKAIRGYVGKSRANRNLQSAWWKPAPFMPYSVRFQATPDAPGPSGPSDGSAGRVGSAHFYRLQEMGIAAITYFYFKEKIPLFIILSTAFQKTRLKVQKKRI